MAWLLICHHLSTGQVGIGTQTPNSKAVLDLSSTDKGLLIPRMTGLQKSLMELTSEDAGMLVFQTDVPVPPLLPSPRGFYFFDGSNWQAPLANGTTNGQTLRWNGNKWEATTNLFNQGSSIGINTSAPNVQFQVHSLNAATSRIQITSGINNGFQGDGMLLGMTLANQNAHVIQQENRPLWFGTNGAERMRIDSVGNVGIGKTNPAAKLDVNGTARIGSQGSILQSIIHATMDTEVPAIDHGVETMVDIPCPNTVTNATVHVSPASSITGFVIGYARISSPGTVEVKFINMGEDMIDPMPVTLHITVIQ